MAVLHSPGFCQNRASPLGWFSPLWRPIPKEISLLREEVHLYLFPIPLPFSFLQSYLLNREKERAERMFSQKRRQEYSAARAVLRFLLSRILHQTPQRILLEEGPFGKPYVVGSDLRFNLAHTFHQGIVALGWEELGVDLEEMRERQWDKLVQRFFSLREQREFESTPLRRRGLSFYLGWTRKEAYLKAWGRGLSLSLSQFSVSLKPEEGKIHHFHTAHPGSYQLVSFFIPQNTLGSLLVLGDAKRLCFFRVAA